MGLDSSSWECLVVLSLTYLSRSPQHCRRVSCWVLSTLQTKRQACGAGCNVVKKASSRELTLLNGQKILRNWGVPRFSLPGWSGHVTIYSPLQITSAWAQGFLLGFKYLADKNVGLGGSVGWSKEAPVAGTISSDSLAPSGIKQGVLQNPKASQKKSKLGSLGGLWLRKPAVGNSFLWMTRNA